MPAYTYEIVREDGTAGETFELFQRMAEKPLTTHPETGAPIRRVIGAPTALKTLSKSPSGECGMKTGVCQTGRCAFQN